MTTARLSVWDKVRSERVKLGRLTSSRERYTRSRYTGGVSQTSDTLLIRELNHIAIYVRDLAVSMKFYGETLELPLMDRPAFNFDGAWYSLGSQELHLIVETNNPDRDRSSFHFALRVDDARAARSTLIAKGVVIGEPNLRPDGAIQVFVRDPDGYLIELMSPGPT